LKFFFSLVIVLLFLLTACSNIRNERVIHLTEPSVKSTNEVDWSYTGKTGPNYWSSIKNEYVLCSKGNSQSPINIEKTNKSSLPLGINYHSGDFKIEKKQFTTKLIPLNHSNSINLRGKNYELIQFHFHTPSEHLLSGKQSALEIHFVHKDANGSIAAIGILVNVGAFNKEFQKVITSNVLSGEGQNGNIVTLNLQSFIPNTSKKIVYKGSLTTPPCTEGVTWIVFKKPIQFSDKQIVFYQNLYYPSNRSTQPINDRVLLESW